MNAARAILFDTVMLLSLLCFVFAGLCALSDWLSSQDTFKWWDQ